MKMHLMTLHMLDQLGADLSGIRARNIPAWGWFWTVRKAVGLANQMVGEAEGEISACAVSYLTYSEEHGTIQLGRRARLADVMRCQVVVSITSYAPGLLPPIKRVYGRQ